MQRNAVIPNLIKTCSGFQPFGRCKLSPEVLRYDHVVPGYDQMVPALVSHEVTSNGLFKDADKINMSCLGGQIAPLDDCKNSRMNLQVSNILKRFDLSASCLHGLWHGSSKRYSRADGCCPCLQKNLREIPYAF
jgi:hypothetical protein